MTLKFDHEEHLLQLDGKAIPEGLIEFGPRDHAIVNVQRFNAAGQNIANYAIPARFVTIDTCGQGLPVIDVFDLRGSQLSFNDPEPSDVYTYEGEDIDLAS